MLPDTIQVPASPVTVTGEVHGCQRNCGVYCTRCIDNPQFSPCPPETLGCGIIGRYSHACWEWRRLGDEAQFSLWSVDTLQAGNTVIATGNIVRNQNGSGCTVGSWIHNPLFLSCVDSTVATKHLSWGRIRALFR